MKFGQWIKSEEQLPPTPEESESYLVTIKGEEVKVVQYCKVFLNNKEICRWEWMNKICPWEILAWMPLPMPYQKMIEKEALIE